jgi:hypothetical protein
MFIYMCAENFEEGFSSKVSTRDRNIFRGRTYVRSECEDSGMCEWTDEALCGSP